MRIVDPDHDCTAGPKIGNQAKERFPAIGCMIKYANRVDEVKRLSTEWKIEHVGLYKVDALPMAHVLHGRFDGVAQIDARYVRAGSLEHIGISASADADVNAYAHSIPYAYGDCHRHEDSYPNADGYTYENSHSKAYQYTATHLYADS